MSSPEPPKIRTGFIGGQGALVDALADAVAAGERMIVPAPFAKPWGEQSRGALDSFRADLAEGEPLDAVVVCTWPTTPFTEAAVAVTLDEWTRHVEWPLACWTSALVGAVERCADGGSVVLVAELPAALDVTGHLAHVVVGEALGAHARSLALAEGRRGVRVNMVSTQLLSAPERPMGSPPPLAGFPGRAEVEVAGAVRLLLDRDARGVTGMVVRADCGRAW